MFALLPSPRVPPLKAARTAAKDMHLCVINGPMTGLRVAGGGSSREPCSRPPLFPHISPQDLVKRRAWEQRCIPMN